MSRSLPRVPLRKTSRPKCLVWLTKSKRRLRRSRFRFYSPTVRCGLCARWCCRCARFVRRPVNGIARSGFARVPHAVGSSARGGEDQHSMGVNDLQVLSEYEASFRSKYANYLEETALSGTGRLGTALSSRQVGDALLGQAVRSSASRPGTAAARRLEPAERQSFAVAGARPVLETARGQAT